MSSLLQSRRSYSTGNPSTSPTPHNSKSDPLPISPSVASSSRPRKVELHPAPLKSTTLPTSASKPPSPPSPAPKDTTSPSTIDNTTSSSTSSSSDSGPQPSTSKSHVEKTEPTPQSQAESIMAQAKEDLRASERMGILTPPPEGASMVKRLIHQAKELFKFYLNGLKMQWTHHKMVNEIKARIKAEEEQGDFKGMTRKESQFIRTHQRDLAKLVPFVLILIVLEEVLPLIVIYAPFMLPSTTILPSQAERIYTKREEKKAATLSAAKWYAERENLSSSQTALSALGVQGLSNDLAWTFARALELSDRGPRSFVNRRISKHLAYITHDDLLLTRESAGSQLTLAELRVALSERGIMTQGLSQQQMLHLLRHWLTSAIDENAMVEHFLNYSLTVEPVKLDKKLE